MIDQNLGIRPWALVTGGSRGIGRGVVKALAADGFDVVFTYRNGIGPAKSLEHECSDFAGKVTGQACDGSQDVAVAETVGYLIETRGAPYALINNMGVTRDAGLLNMSTEHWNDVLATNLNSVFYFTKAVSEAMCEKGEGAIIQMSSVTALKGNRGQTNYGATKAAMLGFTRSLAIELARFNIRVNAVAPGYIETEMLQEMPAGHRKEAAKQIPLRRLGTVDDVAGLVRFLVSSAASYITGQTIVIDGGVTA